jgi:hypothetical protein
MILQCIYPYYFITDVYSRASDHPIIIQVLSFIFALAFFLMAIYVFILLIYYFFGKEEIYFSKEQSFIKRTLFNLGLTKQLGNFELISLDLNDWRSDTSHSLIQYTVMLGKLKVGTKTNKYYIGGALSDYEAKKLIEKFNQIKLSASYF